MSVHDKKRVETTALTQWIENGHEGCLNACSVDNELTFLSIHEGRCFRNCLLKLNHIWPSLKENL